MDELISRQAAIDELVRWGEIPEYNEAEKNILACCIGMLSTLPSVQPEQKTGRWIEFDDSNTFRCSACGILWTTIEGTPIDNDMNFCPHCGAKMEEGE